MSAFLYNMGLFTIQNYILLKLFGKPPQSPHTLVCHKKLHTSQIIEKLKMIQIKFDNHIKLQTSQTLPFEVLTQPQFDNHKKSHTSQTVVVDDPKLSLFYNHIKLHTSQTMSTLFLIVILLWDHIKLHISQTRRRAGNPAVRFTTICLSNMPLNFLSSFEACLPYKITYFSND